MVTCHVFIQGKKEKDKVVATTPGSSQSLLDRWEKRHNWWYCKFGYPYSLLLKNYHYWKTGYQHMSRTVSILLLLQQQGIHPVIKLVMLLKYCIYYGLKTRLSPYVIITVCKISKCNMDFQSTVDSFMVWAGWCNIQNLFPSLSSCDSKIQAIEAKLKLMESGHEKEPSGQGKHPLLVQSEQLRSHPYKKQERHHRGRGRRARWQWSLLDSPCLVKLFNSKDMIANSPI